MTDGYGRVAIHNQSVRATIPNEVVEYLGLKLGDVIEWETFVHNGNIQQGLGNCNNTSVSLSFLRPSTESFRTTWAFGRISE